MHPNRLPISPSTIAIDPQTVYNIGAYTQDFWQTSKSLFAARYGSSYNTIESALALNWQTSGQRLPPEIFVTPDANG